MPSNLRLAEPLHDLIIQAMIDLLPVELAALEAKYNDGISLPAPLSTSIYGYEVQQKPNLPAIFVEIPDIHMSERDTLGGYTSLTTVEILCIFGHVRPDVLHTMSHRYGEGIANCILPLSAENGLQENGYMPTTPVRVNYAPQFKDTNTFIKSVMLTVTIDTVEQAF